MISIIEALAIWANENAKFLSDRGIIIDRRFPDKAFNVNWKASITLTYKDILVSYTVWQRTEFQTELLVMNVSTKKTVEMEDQTLSDVQAVPTDLNAIVAKLLDGTYNTQRNPLKR